MPNGKGFEIEKSVAVPHASITKMNDTFAETANSIADLSNCLPKVSNFIVDA